MKLSNNVTLKKFFFEMLVLLAFIISSSDAIQLRDAGKGIQTANSAILEDDQVFLEGRKKNKKNKKTTEKKKRVSPHGREETETISTSKSKTESKSKAKTKWQTGTQNTPPIAAFKAPYKNDTLSRSTWRDINNTMVRQTENVWLPNHRKWDFKLLDHQLQDIAMDMNYRDEYGHNQQGLRGFIRYFINYFEACDLDGDNQLSRKEFRRCMKNDTFLMIIDIPSKNYSALSGNPLNYTNETNYADTLFDLIDPQESGYVNFHGYMSLRLYIFSWRRCSVAAPFIEESNFECAIEIAAGWKTMGRNTVRKLFFLALEMSGNVNIRNLDFVTYVSFAQAVRLYGKINGKEDNDVTRNELNLALDNNILPLRYNQAIIDYFFKLTADRDLPNSGIDLLTFCFYDFFLKMYQNVAVKGTHKLQKPQFIKIFSTQLMPFFMNAEFLKIPQNNLTAYSYQMYTYLNVSNYQDEGDHFLKSFLQTSSEEKLEKAEKSLTNNKWSTLELYNNNTQYKFNANNTFGFLFNVIDSDMDGWINFYDFGNMIQISYLFYHFDNYFKGRLPAGELYDKFRLYSDFPMVSSTVIQRAKVFNEFPQDLYCDLYSVILSLKIKDLFDAKVRRLDKNLVTEIELKQVLAMVNRRHVMDAVLNRCLRGTTKDNIPQYDWECSFVQSEISTMTYYENAFDRMTTAKDKLVLTNTVFYNIDPSLPQQGTIPDEEKHHGYEIKY